MPEHPRSIACRFEKDLSKIRRQRSVEGRSLDPAASAMSEPAAAGLDEGIAAKATAGVVGAGERRRGPASDWESHATPADRGRMHLDGADSKTEPI
jgi:hypothetical protein